MKAGILFTGSGPIVVLTTFGSFGDSNFVKRMTAKGIKKFIAYEVTVDDVKTKYGKHFDIIMGDLRQDDDLRVLDYDGHRVFNLFKLRNLGEPYYYDS